MYHSLTFGGGAEKYLIDLACDLRKEGVSADVITMDKRFNIIIWKLLSFIYFDWKNLIYKKWKDSEKKITILQKLGHANWIEVSLSELKSSLSNYDVIYTRNEVIELFLLKLVNYQNIPPVIVGMHTVSYYFMPESILSKLHNILYSSFFYKWLLKGANCFHVINSFSKDFVIRQYKMKAELIYHPFSINSLNSISNEYKSNLCFSTGGKNIVFIGRLSEQKGFSTILKIIYEINKNDKIKSNVNLNLFGTGHSRFIKTLKKLSSGYNWLNYYGFVENRYIPDILKKQDLLISPSKWDGLPYNVLEAQALGIPVLAFDIPGPVDIIIPNTTGLLVQKEDEFVARLFDFIMGKYEFDKRAIIDNIKNKFCHEGIMGEKIGFFKRIAKGV